jgi:hypothetical protein
MAAAKKIEVLEKNYLALLGNAIVCFSTEDYPRPAFLTICGSFVIILGSVHMSKDVKEALVQSGEEDKVCAHFN